jgi:hypothetical protein
MSRQQGKDEREKEKEVMTAKKKTLTVKQVDLLYAGLEAWIDILADNLHDMGTEEAESRQYAEDLKTAEDLRDNFYDYFVETK